MRLSRTRSHAQLAPDRARSADRTRVTNGVEGGHERVVPVPDVTKTNRFALIYRVNAVKRAQTRERKIGEFVAMLAHHETIYPQKAKPPNSP
jgi:hypothetical protein